MAEQVGSWAHVSLLLIAFGCLLSRCDGFAGEVKFVMQQASSNCFGEFLPPDEEISKASGGKVVKTLRKVSHETFSFRTLSEDRNSHVNRRAKNVEEKYFFCFLHQGSNNYYNEPRKIIFKYRTGEEEKERSGAVADESSFKKVQTTIDRAVDLFDTVTDKVELMMELENTIADENENTSRTVLLYSIFSCIFLVLTGAYRLHIAKKFLKQLKVV